MTVPPVPAPAPLPVPEPTEVAGQPAPDPGNTDPAGLTADLEDDDDVYERIALVNTEAPQPVSDPFGEPGA